MSNIGRCGSLTGMFGPQQFNKILHEINTEGDKNTSAMDHSDMNASVGHHRLVALQELDLGLLVRLHPELGEHLRQGHLHLGHCEALTCGQQVNQIAFSDTCSTQNMEPRGPINLIDNLK